MVRIHGYKLVKGGFKMSNFGIDSNMVFDINGKSVFTRLGDMDTSINTTNTRTKGITDPRELGAVGDGISDDTAALQAWLNDGKMTKVLRDGIFRVTSVLTSSIAGRTIRTDGAKIIADKADMTVLMITGDKTKVSVEIDGQNKAAIGVDVTGKSCDIKHCTIENLVGISSNGCGIRATTSYGVKIENNVINNVSATANGTLGDSIGAARAILVTSTSAALSLNVVKNNTIAGILGEEGDAIQFLFYDGTLPFLDAQGIIQGNTIKNFNRRGIKIQGSNVKVISNTHINTLVLADVPNANSFINVIQSNDVVVQDNIADGALFIGVSISGASGSSVNRCSVKGNVVKGAATQVGIYFDWLQDCQIEGNTVYDGSTSISGSNSQYTSISENTIYGGTTGNGISIVSNNNYMVVKGNKAPRGTRTYMINNQAPNSIVQDNYGNMGGGLIQTASTATGSMYKDNVNKGAGALVTGTTTGQLLDGNMNA